MDTGELERKADKGELADAALPKDEPDAIPSQKAKDTALPSRMKDVPEISDDVPALHKGDPNRALDPGLDDLGWSDEADVPLPVVHSLKNEDLWLLVRRLNKQIYHVKAIDDPPAGRLDLNIADEDDFSPDKLRSTFERLYMTVFVGAAGLFKHMARLRSWHEPRRTTIFCIAYFAAWVLDLLMPLFFSTLLVLILFRRSRPILFPPIPLAAINAVTGEIQAPAAGGKLGSGDSLTGAEEQFRGEAVEQEASNFVSGITTLAVGSVAGKGAPSVDGSEDVSENEEDGLVVKKEEDLIDPTNMTAGIHEAKAATDAGAEGKQKVNKTKQPVEQAIWEKARPAMHGLNDLADGFERFQNALSPTPPFHQTIPRLRIAGLVLPLFLASLVTNETILYKGATFFFGFAFYGQPIFTWLWNFGLIDWLNKHYPGWRKYLELRNSILLGVPTNAQLTITLLRLGEANNAPLPPPPEPGATTSSKPRVVDPAANAEPVPAAGTDDEKPSPEDEKKPSPSKKKGSRVLGFIRGTTKVGVETVLGADHIKAQVGSEHSRGRRGILTRSRRSGDGPTEFHARHHGKKGLFIISTTATSPCFSFEKEPLAPGLAPEPVFSIAIDDIKEIKKVGGLGWKGKLIVGWATQSRIADGLEVTTKDGRKEKLTAMPRRDEVFNRLIAISPKHKWESW